MQKPDLILVFGIKPTENRFVYRTNKIYNLFPLIFTNNLHLKWFYPENLNVRTLTKLLTLFFCFDIFPQKMSCT